jgi:Tol biopolymer transport system component
MPAKGTTVRPTRIGASAIVGAAAIACVGWASWDRGARSVEPAHPHGPIPVAERTSLRGRVVYSTRAGDLWVMNADGSGRRRLTRSGGGFDFDPSWAPDGRAVVFRTSRGHYVRDRNGTGVEGIFVVDVRTGREREIQPRTGGLFPAWSPDGKLIAFSGLQPGGHGDSIHLMSPSGRNVRDLSPTSLAGGQECATWSPNARRIAYCAHRGDGNWAVWVMNRDGSGKTQISFPTPADPPGCCGDAPGAWSPDGKQIVYSSRRFQDYELVVANSDGSNAYRLTNWRGGDGAAAWLPSGEIVFSHFTGDEPLPHWYLIKPDGTGLRALPWFDGAGDPLDWIVPKPR